MKKFFQKVHLENKFRKAGEGHKLTDESKKSTVSVTTKNELPVREQPLSAPQVNAAVAALERHDNHVVKTSTKRPKKYHKPAEQSVSSVETSTQQSKSTAVKDETSHFSVESVKFISALTGDVISKNELHDHYRETLLLRLGSEDAVNSTCLMIHSLNKDEEKIQLAITTLCKYLENIIMNVTDEKFRKIRKGNKAFSERVANLEGTEEFLNAVGFQLASLSPNEEEEELYFILAGEVDIEKLKEYQNCLKTAKPLVSKVHRNTKVYRASEHDLQVHLPEDFYHLTLGEIKREQENRTESVEIEKQLRTKMMREAPRKARRYNFTLIRIRFPDGPLLQGTFRVFEKFSDVRQFVSGSINVDWAPYSLRTSTGQLIEQENESLESLGLVPCVVLNLCWLEDVKDQMMQQGIKLSIKSELMDNMESLR